MYMICDGDIRIAAGLPGTGRMDWEEEGSPECLVIPSRQPSASSNR
jgi:hypothetical protein